MIRHLRQHPLRPVRIVLLHGVFGGAAGVAVRLARPVLERCVRVRVRRRVQLLLQQVHRVVEEVRIAIPNRDVQLAFSFGPSTGQSRFMIAAKS